MVRWIALRVRYRTLVAQAADEAAPFVATLEPDNFKTLERKFARANDKFAREFLSGDSAKQIRARYKRHTGMVADWLGDLTAGPPPEGHGPRPCVISAEAPFVGSDHSRRARRTAHVCASCSVSGSGPSDVTAGPSAEGSS